MLEKAAVLLRAEQGRLILLTFTWSCSLSLRGEPGLRPGECAPHAPALGSLAGIQARGLIEKAVDDEAERPLPWLVAALIKR